MMMMMMIIIIIIIIIALKGAIRDFLQSPHCAANRLQHVRSRVQMTCNTSSHYHVKYVVIRATWYEIAFILTLFYWLNH